MPPEPLRILCVSQMPPSPPRFGAQARVHGLWTQLAKRNRVTAVTLADAEFDVEESRRALSQYCERAIVQPNPNGRDGLPKRVLQLRSILSPHTFERHRYAGRELQPVIDRVLAEERFDVVHLEFPWLAHLRFGSGAARPPLVFDTHEVTWQLARQFAGSGSLLRRAYGALNWRKLRREELQAFRKADGLCACSAADRDRILADVPGARIAVIPNAADVEFFAPRPGDPGPDGRTVVFFGLLSTVPNVDGIVWFVREIWPRIVSARPDARLRILGKSPPAPVRELGSDRVEVVGFVEDLRPHLAAAAALVVPLRLGGGTRLKIVEGMAMAKPIVSTTLGAEGLDVVPEREIRIADDPAAFAAGVVRLLEHPDDAAAMGRAARAAAVDRYAWSAAARRLEQFYRELLPHRHSALAAS